MIILISNWEYLVRKKNSRPPGLGGALAKFFPQLTVMTLPNHFFKLGLGHCKKCK